VGIVDDRLAFLKNAADRRNQGLVPHSHNHDVDILGVSADDHHEQSHVHDGADGSGSIAHADTTGQTTDDHHARDHAARHASGGADEVSNLVPTGAVLPFVGSSAPTGWLIADGSFVSKTTYADLFAVTGHAFNGGVDPADGTFKLPDLRQRFPMGKAASGTGGTLGGTGGAVDHTHTGPSHSHGLSGGIVSSGAGTSSGASAGPASGGTGTPTDLTRLAHTHGTPNHSHTNDFSVDNDGTGATGTNNPPFQAFNYIVKT
jgi:microcystin-dependent protein